MPRYVQVRNATRDTIIADRARVASSMGDRMVGLLATPEVMPGEGLLVERTQSIHMFFMRYPIDVVFFDTGGRITRLVHRIKPWRIVAWARGARDCLELRAGALEGTDTQVGDQLEITPVELAGTGAAATGREASV
jgi:uncharacterized membrane protein (UPF0127 family)